MPARPPGLMRRKISRSLHAAKLWRHGDKAPPFGHDGALLRCHQQALPELSLTGPQERRAGMFKGVGGFEMSLYRFLAGLVGLALATAVLTVLIGVGTEVRAELAPVVYKRPEALPSGAWACAQDPWPYGCQWRSPTMRRVIRGARPI
jgi:hypothetical protein